MNKAIEKNILFKGAKAAELYDIFLDPKKHSAIHGGAVAEITGNEGDPFSLLNGNLKGRNLKIVPGKMIVQSWRGNVWGQDDPDSILVLVFSDTTTGAKIRMVHACTPVQFTEMWDKIYWAPIKKYLSSKTK